MQLEEVAKALKELVTRPVCSYLNILSKPGNKGCRSVSCKSSLGYLAPHSATIYQHWYR